MQHKTWFRTASPSQSGIRRAGHFLATSANHRSHQYDETIENRARLAIEIAQTVANETGADRIGIRLAPKINRWGIDKGPKCEKLYLYLTGELDKLGLAYLNMGNEPLLSTICQRWNHIMIVNRPGRAREQIGQDVKAGFAEPGVCGALVLTNPDFTKRLKRGKPMDTAPLEGFYRGDSKIYTDFLVLHD